MKTLKILPYESNHVKNVHVDTFYRDNPRPVDGFSRIPIEFKVRDLVTGKHIQKYGGGSSWSSLTHAMNNAKKEMKKHKEPGRFLIEECKIVVSEVYSCDELLKESDKSKELYKKFEIFKANSLRNVNRQIYEIVPNELDIKSVYKLIELNLLNKEALISLTQLMERLEEVDKMKFNEFLKINKYA